MSKWRISEGGCNLREKIMHRQLLLGVQTSTCCDFVNDSRFANWPRVQARLFRERGEGNYLAILSSALWVEKQQSKDRGPKPVWKEDGIQYLQRQARWLCETDKNLSSDIEVDLGAVDEDATRWWTAILAPSEGWRTTITRDDKVYRSPWSISLNASERFILPSTAGCLNVHNGLHIPPSYKETLTFLSDFCQLHNTRSQSFAALAASLTFPFLNRRNATLPMPKPDKVTREVLSTMPLQPSSSASKSEAISFSKTADIYLATWPQIATFVGCGLSSAGYSSIPRYPATSSAPGWRRSFRSLIHASKPANMKSCLWSSVVGNWNLQHCG